MPPDAFDCSRPKAVLRCFLAAPAHHERISVIRSASTYERELAGRLQLRQPLITG